ncbi:hypothetical protein GBF38_006187 [Nibea albiflora]|uniref:Uncharacterized protein n=1 Tax=Nibea albiflora TaxID=240163 RepID=A0ACB7FB55_NIBAL|nr:hypothetical protein GBF38_006187 [Nibea albiflora]
MRDFEASGCPPSSRRASAKLYTAEEKSDRGRQRWQEINDIPKHEERRRNRKTMAMFEVTGSRHAECQQTEHDLLGGKEKTFDRRRNLEMKMDHTRNSTDIVPKGQKT